MAASSNPVHCCPSRLWECRKQELGKGLYSSDQALVQTCPSSPSLPTYCDPETNIFIEQYILICTKLKPRQWIKSFSTLLAPDFMYGSLSNCMSSIKSCHKLFGDNAFKQHQKWGVTIAEKLLSPFLQSQLANIQLLINS